MRLQITQCHTHCNIFFWLFSVSIRKHFLMPMQETLLGSRFRPKDKKLSGLSWSKGSLLVQGQTILISTHSGANSTFFSVPLRFCQHSKVPFSLRYCISLSVDSLISLYVQVFEALHISLPRHNIKWYSNVLTSCDASQTGSGCLLHSLCPKDTFSLVWLHLYGGIFLP